MEVHLSAWIAIALLTIFLISFDVIGHVRKPHAPTLKEAAIWSLIYVVFALVFAGIIWVIYGGVYAGEFIAGYFTEKSLSVDNLFVFIIIMASFKVPREFQQKALLYGIVIALVMRLIFILVGAAVIERFSWIFYLFGIWLLYTAYSQARAGVQRPQEHSDEYHETKFVSLVRKIFPVTDGYIGQRLIYRHNHHSYITPMFLVVVALGGADIMFAFDSIPAIFGLTSEAFLVFSANVFALIGLRQLYFLIDGLLERLAYLHYGLAIILAFIGVKLILHALHENTLPFVNGGQHLSNVPEIGISLSLTVIFATILLTVIVSVLKTRWDKRTTSTKTINATTSDAISIHLQESNRTSGDASNSDKHKHAGKHDKHEHENK